MRESKNFISVSNKVIKMEVISNINNKQFIWFINYMIHRLAADIPTPQEKVSILNPELEKLWSESDL